MKLKLWREYALETLPIVFGLKLINWDLFSHEIENVCGFLSRYRNTIYKRPTAYLEHVGMGSKFVFVQTPKKETWDQLNQLGKTRICSIAQKRNTSFLRETACPHYILIMFGKPRNRQFQHPHLVKLYGVCSEKPIYIITEFMSQGELFRH